MQPSGFALPQVSPTMCAEELTNQVLYMRNIPAGEKDVWMTFEAIEEGELGKDKTQTISFKHNFTSVTTSVIQTLQCKQCFMSGKNNR